MDSFSFKIIIFLSIAFSTQPLISNEKIIIEELYRNYNSNDTVKVSLKSCTNDIVYYSIALEEKTGDDWNLIINDIFKHERDKPGVTNVKILQALEERTIEYPLEQLSNNASPLYGLCRFRIEIKDTPFNTYSVIYSSEFLIEYPQIKKD